VLRAHPCRAFVRLSLVVMCTALPIGQAAAHVRHTIVAPLSTRGAQIVDASGAPVVLQGVNWFGFETSNQVVHGLWTRDYKAMLAQISEMGFNAVRLPFSLQALHSDTINGVDFSNGKNAALKGATPLQAMDVIIKQAARDHLMVLLDCHSDANDGYTEPLWYGAGYSEQDWIDTWRMLAERYRNQPNVIGADLKNEPHGEATWGGGGPTDWRAAAERAGNAILAIDPHWLIVVEGIGGNTPGQKVGTHWWGGNLEGVRSAPVRLSQPHQLVYSAHEYGPGVFDQPWFSQPDVASVLAGRWQDEFGFIARERIAPVLVGEFGGREVGLNTVEGRWQRQFLNYLSRSDISWMYWSLNPDSGDTGGILTDDWTHADGPKLELLQRAIAHQPIAYRSGGSLGAPAPTSPRPPGNPGPSASPGESPPSADSLKAAVVVQSRWQAGWCARLSVTGPDGSLAERSFSFTLPAGTTVTQTWNGEFTATSGRITVRLPSWTRTGGGTYDSSGFCVSGSGQVSELSVA
jgi:endoglucanase